MDLSLFNQVYEENRKLDEMFYELYGNGNEIVRKNKLELLVELGELANETRCFKYWSFKEANRDMVLAEYADCMQMIFYMFSDLDISMNEEFVEENEMDLIDEFMYLFNVASRLKDEYNKDVVKDWFVNFLRLGHLLGFSDEEIVLGCINKININKKRFETGF